MSAEVAEVIVIEDDNEDEQQPAARRAGSLAAGPSQQQQRPPRRRAQEEDDDCVDLTDVPDSPRVEVLSSTVAPAVKRPRRSPVPTKLALMQALIQQARNPPPPPPPLPEPAGIKCGICLEVMGGSSNRPMASGPCGHVYCRDCLCEAVRAQKKCPSCRRNLQVRQIHQVFVELSH